MAEIVYVLGAGVNQPVEGWGGLRPPLAKNFFQAALQARKFSDDHYTERIEPVYAYIRQYWRKTKEQLQAEPFDLEEVFTMLQQQQVEAQRLNDRAGLVGLARVDFLLKSFLAEFLAEFEFAAVESNVMRGFAKIIHHENATIVTFNYDCIVESVIESASGVRHKVSRLPRRAYDQPQQIPDDELPFSHYNWNRPLAYGTAFSEVQLSRPGTPIYADGKRFYAHPDNKLYSSPILKLHGSLNWFRYLPVRKHINPGAAEADLSEEARRGVFLIRGHWWFADPPEHRGWLIDPLLVTPVLDKQTLLGHPIFARIWQRAKEELTGCKKLVVAGYSFPATDFHVRRLFLEAFAGGSPEEVIVVNPDPTVAQTVTDLTHTEAKTVTHADVAEFVRRVPAPRNDGNVAEERPGLRPGQPVIVAAEYLRLGGVEFYGTKLSGVITRQNTDGTYQVRIRTEPQVDDLTLGAESLFPAPDG